MKLQDVMTISELAEYLRLPQSVVEELAREGTLPGKKLGNRWRFHRGAVDRWLDSSRKSGHGHGQSDTVNAQFTRLESFDVVEHAAMVGPWDVRINQLSSGSFNSKMRVIATPGMMIYDERWSQKAQVHGATPEGYDDYIMLGTNVDWRRSQFEWFEEVVDGQRFAFSAQGDEMDFRTPDETHVAAVLVKPEMLALAMGDRVGELLVDRKTIDFQAVDGQRLITLMTNTVQRFAENPAQLGDPFEVRSLQSLFLETLSSCIGTSGLQAASLPASSREAYVSDAIAYAESSDEPLTSLDLAAAVGVSQRTLEYAFRKTLETTPASYLRLQRLNAAHRELSSIDPNTTTVTSIAYKWGFYHPGRFSLAHRNLFDETPSETFRRAGPPPAARFFGLI